MAATSLHELSTKLGNLFVAGLGPEGFPGVFRQLLLLLAKGEPVTPEQIAAALGTSRDEAARLLEELPSAELDEQGNLVGMGLTLRPTPHRFEVGGRTLYTWCALDALLFPFLIGASVRIESPCPVSGDVVRIQVRPDAVEKVEPASAVVSIVTPETVDDVRGAFCQYVHFFRSPEAANAWLADHPGAVIISVAEAHALGRMLARHFLSGTS